MNRFQSVLGVLAFSFIALFGVSVPSAFAACDSESFAAGAGTEISPWEIATIQHLQNLAECGGADNADKYFRITNDLDVGGIADWDLDMGLGEYDETEGFYGNLDGAHHVISNLKLVHAGTGASTNIDTGFIRRLFGTVRRLGFENVTVTGTSDNSYVGVVVGRLDATEINEVEHIGTIDRVYVYGGTISASSPSSNTSVGAIAGVSSGGSITNSYAQVAINSQASLRTGGLVGEANGIVIDRSYFAGDIVVAGEGFGSAGGLVGGTGWTDVYVTRSFFVGDITYPDDLSVGGIVGGDKWGSDDAVDLRWFNESSDELDCDTGGFNDPEKCAQVDSADYFNATSSAPMSSWSIAAVDEEEEYELLDSGLPMLTWQVYDDEEGPIWVIRIKQAELPSATLTTNEVESITRTSAHMYGTAQLNNDLTIDYVAEGDILLGFILNDSPTVDWDNYIHSAPVSTFASNIKTFTTAACPSNNGGGSSGGSRSSGSRPTAVTTVPTTTAMPQAVTQILTQYRSLFVQAHAAGIVLPQSILTFLGIGGATPTPAPAGQCPRDLTVGDEGEDVRALQTLLMKLGYSIAPGATGFFVNYTRDALAEYQRANGLSPAAGYFGAATCAQMKAAGHAGLWW